MRIGIIGYGLFGKTLTELFSGCNYSLAAYDSTETVPKEIRSASIKAIAQHATFIIIAVPIKNIEQVLLELRPWVTSAHLISDVGSVKIKPVRIMQKILSKEIPWVGAHPLFGPTSVSKGERPLQVIICPNKEHPTQVESLKRIYEKIGCSVSSMSPEEHDNVMAYTHALTYFVSKAFFDLGIDDRMLWSPPSFQSMARTILAVRTDAGHLFSSIHTENPFAGDARKQFLGILAKIDKQLLDGNENLQIPSESCSRKTVDDTRELETLESVRDRIDNIDHHIIELLGQRLLCSKRAGEIKKEMGGEIYDGARENHVLSELKNLGGIFGLPPISIEELYEVIFRYSKNIQRSIS